MIFTQQQLRETHTKDDQENKTNQNKTSIEKDLEMELPFMPDG